MAIEDLKQNISTEKQLLREIFNFTNMVQDKLEVKDDEEKKMLSKTLRSLLEQIKIVNNAVPGILESVSPYKSISKEQEKMQNLVRLNIPAVVPGTEPISVTLEKKDKEKFLSELSLSRDTIKRLRHTGKIKKEEFVEFRKAGTYSRICNRFFKNFSDHYIQKGYFKQLNASLRKANLPFLLVTYLSMIFFTTSISILVGILGFVFLAFLFPAYIGIDALALTLPIIVFISLYFYPSAEAKSIEDNIGLEIPFVTIHMSAIAGSGIEPTQVFKIIALGSEYPYTKTEFKKIINQVNVYGYDLVTALKNTARETSSRKLSELLNGMASSISGGSQLNEFLDKRAESLLFEYKLEKEKYTKTTETIMDVYISIMVAAPMIMTLLLVLITVSNISIGMSTNALTLVIISIVALINLVFLVFLKISQKSY